MKPLLTIELDDINAIPKVFYQGEEITGRIHVKLDWKTKTDNIKPNLTNVRIEYAEGHNTKVIEHNPSDSRAQ